MKIAVCIKQVVSREWQVRVNDARTWVRDEDAAWARPDAEKAWLAGEDVFAGVPVDPAGDAFTLSGPRNIYDAAFG